MLTCRQREILRYPKSVKSYVQLHLYPTEMHTIKYQGYQQRVSAATHA